MKFQNLRVVVTGASRYFGRAIAIGFAHLGAEVFVSARTVEAAERTRAEVLGEARSRIHAFGCDLSKPSEIQAFARQVGEHTDRVDLLVNNGARWLDGFDLEAPPTSRSWRPSSPRPRGPCSWSSTSCRCCGSPSGPTS